MGMQVQNNSASMLILGQVNKNQSDLQKQLKKVATGMKLVGAGDGAAEYSISEKMRVKIRALGQDEINVQNGASLLHTAEGGVQQQIELMKSIKEKVLAANNDTATDQDRQTIQKEISQSYDQMQDIAAMTSYNGRRVLLGGHLDERVFSWEIKDEAVLAPDSDAMNVIPDQYDTLDGVKGPFDVFKEYSQKSSTIDALGLAATQNFGGATDGTANTISINLSDYNSVDALDNVGFAVSNWWYVFTKDTSRNYHDIDRKIDISGCTTMAEVAQRLQSSASTPVATISASGAAVTFTTAAKSSAANSTTVTGITRVGDTQTSGGSAGTPARAAAAGTGLFPVATHLSGGSNEVGSKSSDPDKIYKPGVAASLTQDISSAPAGSGITISGSSTIYLKFVDGTSGLSGPDSTGVYTVGKNAAVSMASLGGDIYLSMSGGVMTLNSSAYYGGNGNNYSVVDTIPAKAAVPATSGTTTTYTAVTPYGGTVDNKKTGSDGTPATYTIDLSGYNTSDAATLETFIAGIAGKAVSYDSRSYEFVDSAASPELQSLSQINGTTTIDLNSLRTMVSGTTTIASAFASLMAAQAYNAASVTDAGGTVTGVKLTSTSVGAAGNSQTITVSEGTLRSYDIDYSSWFAANHPSPVASYLNGKGFRAYCATDSKQWFNFIFTDGTNDADKPKSGTAAQDIKSILIDVSKVTDAASLVQTIYDQAEPVLTGADPSYNHHMRVAADTDKGILTLYDDRRFNVNTSEYDYQEKGAKIADGVFDNVIKSERDIDVDEVIIQHTDKASKNIHLKIPRTTLDHVFGYRAGEHTPDEYNVLTRTMRERLLGIPPDKGILDNGLEYLTAANTLIGAQTNHMEAAQQNIITERTNTTAADSTIRDADMAKTMADYARDSILSNAAMSMLSQANQSAGSVVSLLKA